MSIAGDTQPRVPGQYTRNKKWWYSGTATEPGLQNVTTPSTGIYSVANSNMTLGVLGAAALSVNGVANATNIVTVNNAAAGSRATIGYSGDSAGLEISTPSLSGGANGASILISTNNIAGSFTAGDINIRTGTGNGSSSNSGNVNISTTGPIYGAGSGRGSINLTAGNSGGGQVGPNVNITAGAGASIKGGNVIITAGGMDNAPSALTAPAGDVIINPGQGTTIGLQNCGAFTVNGVTSNARTLAIAGIAPQGSLINLNTGAGSAHNATSGNNTGGAGGTFSSILGSGGSATATSGVGTGGAGGSYSLTAGAGAAGTSSGNGGVGGGFTFTPGAGGGFSAAAGSFTIAAATASTARTNAGTAGTGSAIVINGGPGANNTTTSGTTQGGAGGSLTSTLGAGGTATGASATGTGGKGGSYAFTAGNGGNGTTTGGAGGDYSITLGNAGTGGNANAGNFTLTGGTATGTGTISRTTVTATFVNLTGSSFGRGAPVTISGTTYTVGNFDNWIICNQSGALTITLPTASAWTGRELMFKNISAFSTSSASSNVVPLTGGAATADILGGSSGATTWCTMVSDGTNWIIMQGY